MVKTIRVAGFGGQGVMLFGQLMAYMATLKNLNSTWVPTYGPETRGGTANCMVTISDGPIFSPVFKAADHLIVFNAPSYQKFKTLLNENGTIFYNASLIEEVEKNPLHVAVKCNELATSLDNIKVLNIIMMGRYLKELALFSREDFKAALTFFFGESKKTLIDINLLAFELGYHS